jgi:hypothetical protein
MKKTGILLNYVLHLTGMQAAAHITLPGGATFTVEPLPIPGAEIAALHVMYYPDRFVQILVFGGRRGPHPLHIPITELPPHQLP